MKQTGIPLRKLVSRNISTWLLVGLTSSIAIADSEKGIESAPLPTSVQAADSDNLPESVDVFFVTNREHDASRLLAEVYTGKRGEPHAGRCVVEFKPIQVLNQLAPRLPFYLLRETRKIVVADQEPPEQFWRRLENAIAQNASQSVVVFVHGYNYSFTRTCHMAAELQRSLDGKATVLMFSWPSNGSPTDYVSDQADVEWSVPSLATLLAQLEERLGADKIQVLAHSLGSRGVIFALQRLRADLDQRPLIDRLVLLAPDFDAQTFAELLPRLAPLSSDITLYASSNDTPLRASQELNGHPRLGQAGDYLTVLEGMETIDVSPAGLYQIMGHEYFFYHPRVSADLVTHIGSGAPASERPGLRLTQRDGVTYWELIP
jgi:esterase/lipase superfamily enzyme